MLPLLLADIFYTIREVALDGMIIVPSMIVIERMFSILKAKTYENWFSWKFIIVICCSVCYFISYCAMAKKSVIGLTLSERYQHAENQAAYGTVLKFAITTALIIIIASLLLVLRQYLPSCFKFFRFALCKRNKVAAAGESTSVVHIQSFTGQNLKVPDETNFYFKSLTDQWDAKLVKTKKPLVKIS
uniref:Serpentine receptor class gamma n=1 Tax=Panagrellus redivivus TaxID=6233 RepID=A0A7E4VT31_PANRE